MSAEHIGNRTLSVALEASAWFVLLASGCLAVLLRLLSVRGASLFCILLMLALIASAWRNFEGGRHPCFLFLGMLFIFQCGRLPGFWTGNPEDPFAVDGLFRFSVSPQSQEITLLLIALSAVCVYVVCRFTYRAVVFLPGPEQRWLRPLYVLLAVTLPFALYKNYMYLSFVRSHGGYMAIFTDSEDLLQSAGVLVRSVALVGTTVLLLLYAFERRKKHLIWLLSLFFVVSTMDLLIGLRGKFFVQILLFWYIRNLKTGRKFNLVPLFSAALMVSLLAVVIAGFRENRDLDSLGPLGFLAGQGVSIDVTELAVEYHKLFENKSGWYLLNEAIVAFDPGPATLPGNSFDIDLSNYVNPEAAALGYGTGGSYLAEAYLFGGIAGVICVSLLIGIILAWLHKQSSGWVGAALMMAALGPIIYMPRTGLISPLSFTLKTVVAMAAVILVLFPMRGLLWLCRMNPRDRLPDFSSNLSSDHSPLS